MCFIVCVLFLFSDFFCLMIGKTFVMFGYANKEFEFEFVVLLVLWTTSIIKDMYNHIFRIPYYLKFE